MWGPHVGVVLGLLLRGLEPVGELVDRGPQRADRVVVQLTGLGDVGEDLRMVVCDELVPLGLEATHVTYVDRVEVAVGTGPDRDNLALHRERRGRRLLEQLDHPHPAGQLLLAGLVQVGAERGEGLQLAVLGQVDAQPAGHRLHRLRLGGTTDPRDRDADIDRGTDAGIEQVGLQEALTVGDGNDVGRDVSGDVVALGFDNGQTGHRAGAQLVGELGAAFQQPGVQVEHIARVRLAAGRATQQQRHRPVGLGLLGQVVEHDQDMLALVHPVLADGRAGVRRDVLVAGRIGGRRRHDARVGHGAGVLQDAAHGGDGAALLPDGHVDAADLLRWGRHSPSWPSD